MLKLQDVSVMFTEEATAESKSSLEDIVPGKPLIFYQ